jgi:hypothetical protein
MLITTCILKEQMMHIPKSTILFFGSTEVWTQGLHLEPLHQPFFVKGFFKLGSRELFAWSGFEP